MGFINHPFSPFGVPIGQSYSMRIERTSKVDASLPASICRGLAFNYVPLVKLRNRYRRDTSKDLGQVFPPPNFEGNLAFKLFNFWL